MIIIRDLIEGETDPFIVPLLEDGVALVGTGLTLTDVLVTGKDRTTQVNMAGKFAWASQAGGTVTISPGASDFLASLSPYTIRILLTDGAGKTRYYPNGEPAYLTVRTAR